MQVEGLHHLIERSYRDAPGAFHWGRETYINCIQANATRIEYGVEWQAVESKGVYRRTIADNGIGMDPDELIAFFNFFGGSGKIIGPTHENFGIGAKTSLLPWNHHGVVLVTWQGGEPCMTRIWKDPNTGEYGLKQVLATDPDTGDEGPAPVYYPYDDPESGCDWNLVKPDWITDHGSVITLMGNSPTDNTVKGDPSRDEAGTKGLANYLNNRIWDIPDDVEVYVDELRSQWPASKAEALGQGPSRRNHRRIWGAHHYIDMPQKATAGRTLPSGKRLPGGTLVDSGTVTVTDPAALDKTHKSAVEIDWFLWEGARPVMDYASTNGYIATLYDNELYDVTSHLATYRSFGVTEGKVRENLWLIIRPEIDNGHYGVYPKSDRMSLAMSGVPSGTVPRDDWALLFAQEIPDAIQQAQNELRKGGGGTINDEKWRDRLAARFSKRWRVERLRKTFQIRERGGKTVTATEHGTVVRVRPKNPNPQPPHPVRPAPDLKGQTGELTLGRLAGSDPAKLTHVYTSIPDYEWVGGSNFEAGMLAQWLPSTPGHPGGIVQLNHDHPVIMDLINYWQAQYIHNADLIKDTVFNVYGEVSVAKVAHSAQLTSLISEPQIHKELRSPGAMTMALLGLMAEESVIATRIGGKLGKRRVLKPVS